MVYTGCCATATPPRCPAHRGAAEAFASARQGARLRARSCFPARSHPGAEESPAAQCIAPEEQSGSALKAKISVLKDAIKQSRGRVYREAIAVRGEKWSPEANPTGFIACYR